MTIDLYFAGVGYPIATEYIMTTRQAPKLFSPVHDKRDIKLWTDLKRQGKTTSKLFIDSGAFTAHTKGSEVDVDEYIEYINGMIDVIDVFAQVDKIPGTFGKPRSKEDILNAPKESWENYLYMRERVKDPDKLLPIFHQDEDFKWLRNMLEWTDENGKHIPYIGISGAKDKPTKSRLVWYAKVFEIIHASSNPNVKTHAFGTQIVEHLEQIPFTSADATSWLKSAVFGSIFTPWGITRISKETSKVDYNHIVHKPHNLEEVKKYVQSIGFQLEPMIEQVEGMPKPSAYRSMFNVEVLCRWAETYKYKGPKIFKPKGLFTLE